MSTMKNFHKQLNASPGSRDAYINALAALTTIGRSQLTTLASTLEWQTWETGVSQPAEPAQA